MDLHCPNCSEVLDRVATVCPACNLDLRGSAVYRDARETIDAADEARRVAAARDEEWEQRELLASVTTEERLAHPPPPWHPADRDDPGGPVYEPEEDDVVPDPKPRRWWQR